MENESPERIGDEEIPHPIRITTAEFAPKSHPMRVAQSRGKDRRISSRDDFFHFSGCANTDENIPVRIGHCIAAIAARINGGHRSVRSDFDCAAGSGNIDVALGAVYFRRAHPERRGHRDRKIRLGPVGGNSGDFVGRIFRDQKIKPANW